MAKPGGFYTLKGYQANSGGAITPAMEDYLEMIYRMLKDSDVVRIGELAALLHVNPSSTTKMIQQLMGLGYVETEKYGYIQLTEKGKTLGSYLFYRHDVLQAFLCELNGTEDELEQAEQIEHFLNPTTIKNLDTLTKLLKKSGYTPKNNP